MNINRRQFERFLIQPGYSRIAVRPLNEFEFDHEGHAYNVCEGGVMFEIDRPIAAGTEIAVQLWIPGLEQDGGPGRSVFAFGRVVWMKEEDLDDGGPVRMAVAFTRFARAGDRERLLRVLSTGRYARAA